MASGYYKPCEELARCNELIERYWSAGEYELCFRGHLELAERGYPLAECQVGYFYLKGYGVPADLERAVYWTRRAAEHGDWDAQYNLASFYEEGAGVEKSAELARQWYTRAARQGHELALERCRALGIAVWEAAEP